jgi:hypothetical protein
MEPPIVVFDGVCVLCNRLVHFIGANDPAGRVRFQASQQAGDTVVLLAGGRRYERSDAVLHLLLELRWPWPLGVAQAGWDENRREAGSRAIATTGSAATKTARSRRPACARVFSTTQTSPVGRGDRGR